MNLLSNFGQFAKIVVVVILRIHTNPLRQANYNMSSESKAILPMEKEEEQPETIQSDSEEEEDEEFPTSGVCDSPSQLSLAFPNFKGRVKFHCIKRENEPPSGGWRWHKWGDYYGKHDLSRVEYLFQADGRKLSWSSDGARAPLIDEQWYFTTGDKIGVLDWDEETYELGSPGPGDARFIRRERGESLASVLGFGFF